MQGVVSAAAVRSRLPWWAGPAGAAAAAVSGLTLVGAVDPNVPGHYPTCPFLAVTGYWCPGCGSLRAGHALAEGDVASAFGLNALAVLSIPVLLVLWWRWAARLRAGRRRSWAAPAGWLWALGVLVVAFAVVRNLPAGTALAP